MRYILDNEGYIEEVSFGAEIICNDKNCTEYTGTIPDGYESLLEWSVNANIRAYKIVDGNLAYDSAKDAELQALYEQEQYDNSCVTHKELEGITSTPQSLKDLYENKKVIGEVVTFNDGSDLAINKINIKPLEELTNEINLTITGANMLPNEFTTLEQDEVTFTQNKDKSIAINGTVSNDIEVNLAGTSTSTNYILTFKKGITYKISGLVDNVSLNFYCFDGTDRELVLTSGNGEITLDIDKHVTQITISVKPTYTKRNVQVDDDLSGKTLYFEFPDGFRELLNGVNDTVIQGANGKITEVNYTDTGEIYVGVHNGDNFYSYDTTFGENVLTECTMPDDFGTVTSINTDSISYEYIFIKEETPFTFKNTIYPMLSIDEKEYEPYNGSHYKINLGSNVVSSQELYPNMVYPSDNVYPGAYHYITIEDGEVNLYQGNDEISLNNIEMPSTLIGNNTIYAHQDTRLLIDYIVGGAIAQRNIHLEGYTTINNGFSVDLEGNMTCNDATFNGGNIDLNSGTEDNPTFKVKSSTHELMVLAHRVWCKANEKTSWWLADDGEGKGNLMLPYDGYINCFSTNGTSTEIDGSGISTPIVTQTSLESQKKNVETFEEGLSIITNTDIYKYHLIGQEDNEKKHIGFVIGEDRKYSSEITAVDKTNKEIGVDIYSMVSVCFNAIKELNNKIEQLENKIKELESEDNGEN